MSDGNAATWVKDITWYPSQETKLLKDGRLKMTVKVADNTISIDAAIHSMRGEKIILDADLARIYGVTTKRLNEQVKRNARRFPADFAFRLSKAEWELLTEQIAKSDITGNRSQIATGSQKHRDPRFLPYAFTEHGAHGSRDGRVHDTCSFRPSRMRPLSC